ncbi:MAG: crosslink repair DNA glycosylase YcaQ family protein [Actinomycetota bacterium]
MTVLSVDAAQIIDFRLRANGLRQRAANSAPSLQVAAAAGLQDSMPRAAVLSLHARVRGVDPCVLDDPTLIQVWGPGFSAYVVAANDVGVFTLGRYPESGTRRTTADTVAARLSDVLDETPRRYRDVAADLGIHHDGLRYAALLGTIRLHWAGSGKPLISLLSPPAIDWMEARCELGRRFLHAYGPATADDFSSWAGVNKTHARRTLAELDDETIHVTTPLGSALLLASDEALLRSAERPEASIRFLPSGDPVTLWTGEQRTILLPEAHRRERLWTPRVWPGALLVGGRIAGAWRRSGPAMSIETWDQPTEEVRVAVEAEAGSLPLEEQPLSVSWTVAR